MVLGNYISREMKCGIYTHYVVREQKDRVLIGYRSDFVEWRNPLGEPLGMSFRRQLRCWLRAKSERTRWNIAYLAMDGINNV
jgi:hypothetical protein